MTIEEKIITKLARESKKDNLNKSEHGGVTVIIEEPELSVRTARR